MCFLVDCVKLHSNVSDFGDFFVMWLVLFWLQRQMTSTTVVYGPHSDLNHDD